MEYFAGMKERKMSGRMKTGFFSAALTLVLCGSVLISGNTTAYADETEAADTDKIGYIVFGEDLTKDQQKTVLGYFGLSNTDMYNVSYCSNKQEHEAFDDYLDSSVIGTKAVSSILMEPQEEGTGISIVMKNITYCTEEMYQNALISAGVEDVTVSVAAPFEVSGTCALVSAMNAYELMTGEELDDTAVDTAVDELVTTGEIGDAIGDNDDAAEMIATLKQKVAENGGNLTEDQLSELIDQTAEEMNISLDDQIKQELLALLQKIQKLDIDTDALKQQAGDLYNKISDLVNNSNIQIPDVTEEQAMGFFQKLIQALKNLLGWS